MKKLDWILLNLILLLLCAACDMRTESKTLKFSGTLEMTDYSLGAKVAGRLVAVNFDDGSLVKKGDLLAVLDRFEQTQKDLNRVVDLFKAGGATEQSVENAHLANEDQRIISPIDGVVLVKVQEVGEVAAAGSTIAVIGDPHDLWIKIFIPEGQINTVKVGQSALVYLDGISDSFQAHVSYVAPNAEFTPRNVQTKEERVTQMFAVKVKLDSVPPNVHAGVSADVEIQ